MAYIDDLISNVKDPRLRALLAAEVAHIKGRKSFGLVFERHIPETAALHGFLPREGSNVMLIGNDEAVYVVESIDGSRLSLRRGSDGSLCKAAPSDVLVTAELGQTIYPSLRSLSRIDRSSDRPSHKV